jgi:hypothetical protein
VPKVCPARGRQRRSQEQGTRARAGGGGTWDTTRGAGRSDETRPARRSPLQSVGTTPLGRGVSARSETNAVALRRERESKHAVRNTPDACGAWRIGRSRRLGPPARGSHPSHWSQVAGVRMLGPVPCARRPASRRSPRGEGHAAIACRGVHVDCGPCDRREAAEWRARPHYRTRSATEHAAPTRPPAQARSRTSTSSSACESSGSGSAAMTARSRPRTAVTGSRRRSSRRTRSSKTTPKSGLTVPLSESADQIVDAMRSTAARHVRGHDGRATA